MQTRTTYFSTISGGKIDRATGVISGVSVITLGEAKGHDLKIDGKTLETVQKVASEFSTGVKVKMRHKQDGEHQNVLTDTIGVLKSFSVDGNKTRADLHLLKSLSSETKEKIFEMAETMPDQFGFSIHFTGVSEEIKGEKFARCQDLLSIDLSDNPAANPDGLFSMKDSHKDGCDCADCKKLSAEKQAKEKAMSTEELAASVNKLTELVNGLSKKLESGSTVGTITYKGEDGKDIQLSGKEIATALSQSNALAAEAKKNSDLTARNGIIAKMSAEGRVAMNPKTSKAYTLEELNTLPIETLQFAAINSPVIPLEAKAVYRGDDKTKAVDPKLKGSDLIRAEWDEKYGNIHSMMLSTPVNGN